MTELSVQKVPTTEDRSLPIFSEFERLADRIRLEAFNLFSRRGSDGRALDDWLEAERKLCWPAAKLTERDDAFVLEVALAGFAPNEISVTATPRDIMIKASHSSDRESEDKTKVRWSEFRSNEVFRRIEFPANVDVKKVTANLDNGLLTVVAPRAEAGKSEPVKIAVAEGPAPK